VIRIRRTLVVLSVLAAAAGCASPVDIERVPIGTSVEVTRQDGGVIRGTLNARDDQNVRLGVGRAVRSIPRNQIAGVELTDGTKPTPLVAKAKFREFTVPEGTELSARLNAAIGSDTSQVGDPVEATLTEAVTVDGVEILPTGSVVTGVVTMADPAGKVSGRAGLSVRFQSVSIAGRDEKYDLSANLHRTAAGTKSSDAKKIGIPAAGGAIIGAIVGGKKGAGIGAVVGGGAGTAVVLATSGPEVRFPGGSVLSLALEQPIDVRMPLKRAL
jgi:hypothetical protein